MKEHTHVLLGKLCLQLNEWNKLSIPKRISTIFGVPIITFVVTYLLLLITINWQTRLYEAAKDGDISKAKTALFFHADLDGIYSFDGKMWPAVNHALRNTHPEMFTFLINRGANIDYKLYDDEDNWYHVSTQVIRTDDPSIIETFITLGGKLEDCTYRHHNALTYAISLQKVNSVQTLSKYFDINTPDRLGLFPLAHAYNIPDKEQCTQMLELLHILGADIDHQTDDSNTALHQYLSLTDLIDSYEAITEVIDFVKKYSKKGLDIANRQGMTPLMAAAHRGNGKAMDILVWRGSNLHFTNKKGKGVFDMLSQNGHDDLFSRYASKLKENNPKAFKKLQKKFPKRIGKNGVVIKRQKRIASSRKKYRGTKRRGGLGKKILRRLGPVGFFLSLF